MKSKRQALILELIAKQNIETQEELADALRGQGINVTQATVSRDIKELRLIKVLNENGGYRYSAAEKTQQNDSGNVSLRMFGAYVVSVETAGNIVVLKTIAASASTCAEVIDTLGWPEILGTIAGENTVLAIVKNIEDVDGIAQKFRDLVKGNS